MTIDEIVDKFNLQVDDASELSTVESFDLANDVYKEVQNDRPWCFLKTSFSGSTSASVPYIALPSDFKEIAPNYLNESVVFVGTDYSPYKVISYDDRRNYRDQDGFCYIDIGNSRLVFTLQPTAVKTVEYDYIKILDPMTTGTSPAFGTPFKDFHRIIMFGMAMKFPSIEQAEKGTSYATDNRAEYLRLLSDMAILDANIKLAHS